VITAWRIVRRRWATNAFDGEGARLNGGRWSSPGTRVVYVSESIALAALEMLVHLGHEGVLPDYVLIPCTFDEGVAETVPSDQLPRNWRTYPASPALQAIGDAWVISGKSAVLRVPSAIIPLETNYLLNPAHPDFQSITIGAQVPFALDRRLLRR